MEFSLKRSVAVILLYEVILQGSHHTGLAKEGNCTSNDNYIILYLQWGKFFADEYLHYIPAGRVPWK